MKTNWIRVVILILISNVIVTIIVTQYIAVMNLHSANKNNIPLELELFSANGHPSNSKNKDCILSASSATEILYGLSSGTSIIEKKFNRIKSSPKHLKLIFIVGVEGSGHHLWNSMFKHIKSDKYIYYDNVWTARAPLQKCLLLCFSVTYWDETPTNTLSDWLDRSFPGYRNIDNYCDCFIDNLKLYADKMVNSSLLVLNHAFSYTFNDLVINHYPDLSLLINLCQSDKLLPYIFDVRLIVMKRDYASILVSSCVHRFGYCQKRIQYTERGLSLIQSQLLTISTQFWIMIDYDHFVTNIVDLSYVDIISKWLSLDTKIVKKMFDTIEPSRTTLQQSQWTELKEYKDPGDNMTFLETIKRVFYDDSFVKWPLFNSGYFCVTPDNKRFLNTKRLN